MRWPWSKPMDATEEEVDDLQLIRSREFRVRALQVVEELERLADQVELVLQQHDRKSPGGRRGR